MHSNNGAAAHSWAHSFQPRGAQSDGVKQHALFTTKKCPARSVYAKYLHSSSLSICSPPLETQSQCHRPSTSISWLMLLIFVEPPAPKLDSNQKLPLHRSRRLSYSPLATHLWRAANRSTVTSPAASFCAQTCSASARLLSSAGGSISASLKCRELLLPDTDGPLLSCGALRSALCRRCPAVLARALRPEACDRWEIKCMPRV